MKDNWLEKGLKDKLGDYDSPMDLESAWNALEAKRLPEKKKRRLLVWWGWGIGLLLLVSVVGGYYFWQGSTSQSEISQSAIPEVENNTTKDFFFFFNNDTNNTKDLFTGHTDDTSAKDKVLNNKSNFSQKSEASLLPKKAAEDLSIEATNTTQVAKPSVSQDLLLDTRNKGIRSSVVKSSSPTAAAAKEDSRLALSSAPQKAIAPRDAREAMLPMELLAARDIALLETGEECPQLEFALPAEYSPASIRRRNRRSLPKYLGIAGGYSFSSKGRVFTEEVPVDLVSSQLFYQKYLTKKIYFKTSLHFDQFTNRSDSSKTSTYMQTVDNQIVGINYYQDGREEKISGTADVEVRETISYTIYNRYRFLSVPLIVGVKLAANKKNNFEIEGGFAATIFNEYDVKYVEPRSVEKITPFEKLDLVKKGMVSGLYAVQWNCFPFDNQNWGFFLKYQGQFQLNKLSKPVVPDFERFGAQQFFVGVKYHL